MTLINSVTIELHVSPRIFLELMPQVAVFKESDLVADKNVWLLSNQNCPLAHFSFMEIIMAVFSPNL